LDYATVPTTAADAPTNHPVNGRETAWAVTVPLWAMPAVLAILPLAWLARANRRAARRRRARLGICEGCGYDLRASRESGRCPECGREFKA
jgi:hypothetical protein